MYRNKNNNILVKNIEKVHTLFKKCLSLQVRIRIKHVFIEFTLRKMKIFARIKDKVHNVHLYDANDLCNSLKLSKLLSSSILFNLAS